MALKGKSFSIDTGKLDNLIGKFVGEEQRIRGLTERKVKQATDIIWRVARQRRPMITKAMMKAQGRTRRVSDPAAEAGVPVQSGALQNSIVKDVQVKRHSVLGTITAGGQQAPYAKFVEFGTSKMAARPFMRPAIMLTQQAIKAMFAKKENA